MGHGIRTHRTAKNQQNGRQDGRLDHGQCDAGHDAPLGCIQDGSCFLQIGIHILEDAANQDIGKGCIVKAQHHQAREHALTPPQRHFDAEQGCQQTVGRSGNSIGVKQVLPDNRQRPLGHDIRENEDRA